MPKNSIKKALELISRLLPENDIAFLLVGGFAVNYYGYTRSTLDLDLMIAVEVQERLKKVMLQAGYTNFSQHKNVVFFQKPGTALRLDFLKAEADSLQKLLSRSKPIEIAGVALRIPCLSDLLAMKLFAIEHGREFRGNKDLEDIVQLVIANRLDPDKDIKPLCQQYTSNEVYEQLCQRINQYPKS